MRVLLLYPPPWKIPLGGEPADPCDGPPKDYREGDLDGDFFQTPYGLFTLGAQAIRDGHLVKVLNLSGFAWKRVEEVIDRIEADVYGLSCWTANRRGVALVAKAIKARRPRATVVVGGPHATPLAREVLAHHAEIDLVSVGESEEQFREVLERVGKGEPLSGIAGTAYRDAAGTPVLAPERPAISNLDTLAPVQPHFDTHILMTSRGCPWQCTFCGAETSWGRGFRGHSLPYVLDAIEASLARLPVKMIQIKDDTFTANRKRALEIARGIRQRDLRFLWSCDTRVDVLSEELLREMRLAGCQRLSLGVESGSQKILDAIHKKITVPEILEACAMAKRFGVRVRFYMMLGNRGETAQTFRETLDFLAAAQPHEYIFSCLSIYPGTRDFEDAERAGWLSREVYFSGDFQELKTPFDATPEDAKLLGDWFAENKGLRTCARESSSEFGAILERLGDHHAAHVDLAGALYREGELDRAEHHLRRALELGYPCPGLVLNYLGCIAFRRGDIAGMQQHFLTAARSDPQHAVLIRNVQAARRWFQERGPERGVPLELEASHDFSLLERNAQPTLPGPLPEGFADWQAHEPTPTAAPAFSRDGGETRLKVL
jgi:radical SAM superfamily enzyme YgiQ (UPF0313 family)